MKTLQFDWMEYTVFGLMLGVSALIGVYYGFIKKKGQDTVDGYLLGGKEMGLLPISVSLIASFISITSILGIPVEIYTYGTQFLVAVLCFFTNAYISVHYIIPVFHKLQLISAYQYMEMRFNKTVRNFASILYTLSLLVYVPVVIYGPALALSQVFGIGVCNISAIVAIVCIFYTSVGGLKAVVWTGTVQAFAMVLAVVAISIIGTIKAGGFFRVIDVAAKGERTEFFNMDLDPRVRASFWSLLIGLTVHYTGAGTVNPSAVQRVVALKTLRLAKLSVLCFVIGGCFLFIVSGYTGLVIYAQYKDCDPKYSGRIARTDQILPYFILDIAGNIRGLTGIFMAAILSASLSTMSTCMNTVAGTLYKDLIGPIFGKMTEATAVVILKILVAAFGSVCLLLVTVIDKLDPLIEVSNVFGGITGGIILGMFILGMFFPHANSIGTASGGLLSLLAMGWLVVGSRNAIQKGEIVQAVKPVSIDNCPFWAIITIIGNNKSMLPPAEVFGKAFPLFELSIFYYSVVGCLIVVVVGLVVSYVTGPNKVKQVDKDLLSPLIYPFLPTFSTSSSETRMDFSDLTELHRLPSPDEDLKLEKYNKLDVY